MRVLHLISSGGVYGAEKMLFSLVSAQVAQGLSPMILFAADDGVTNELEFEAKRLGVPAKAWPMRSGLDFSSCKKLLDWAKDENYRILHTHGYKFTVLIGILNWLIPHHFLLVATCHGYTHNAVFSRGSFYAFLDKLCRAAFFNQTVLVGQSNKENLVDLLACKSAVVPNGIPIFETGPKKRRGFHVLAIGRLSPEKNYEVLLRAFHKVAFKLTDSVLTIAGDGADRQQLEQLAHYLKISDRVEFKGYVKDVSVLLSEADLFVNCSLTEGLPITILEAINSEVPVVATDVGSVSSIFAEGHSYPYLVNSDDIEHLTNCMISALLAPDDEINRLTSKQKLRLRTEFSSDIMANRYLCIYKKLTQETIR